MAGAAEVAHGPMLIGTTLNILLCGIMITQVYIYFTTYRRDRLFMKILVSAVFLLDAANTAFDVSYLYVALIKHFGNTEFLRRTNWQFATDPLLTGLISLLVQLFFAWRVHVLTSNFLLVSIVVLLSLASGSCALVSTWEVMVVPEFVRFQEFKGVVIVWLACSAAADIMITAILVWHLHKSNFKQSNLVIDRIIRMTVQTGFITSVVAILDLSLYLASPSGTHLIFNFPLAKLYSNSLISSLNARGGWRNDNSTRDNLYQSEGQGQSNHDNLTSNGWQEQDATASRRGREKSQILLDPVAPGNIPRTGVFVHVESHEMRDMVESLEENPQADNKAVVIIPRAHAQNKEASFSSLSDTYDLKGSAV